MTDVLTDTMQRPLRDLRISVTDRCNFRCHYCMPGDRDYHFLPRSQVLTFEEIADVARLAVAFGAVKIRLTGGEPLLRRDLPLLVSQLAAIDGVADLALTTNGSRLAQLAKPLKDAGLQRVTVSLDSLEPATFHRLSGGMGDPQAVLHAIDHAAAVGLTVKINTVVQRGENDDELVDLADTFRQRGLTVRFIEFMDVGNLNAWQRSLVMPAADILERITATFPAEPVDSDYPGEVANRYRYLDGGGEFGIIASITQPFCGSCSRLRLSADGTLYTCLFANSGLDIKSILRGPRGREGVRQALRTLWQNRRDRYSEERAETKQRNKVEMFRMGG